MDNLLGTPPTHLPVDPAASLLAAGSTAYDVAARHPTSSLAWAVLAEDALVSGRVIEAYAFARTGYHRGLDALRRAGWRGQGPVPWSHAPNQGFLRALAALAQAAEQIGEDGEAARCQAFITEAAPDAPLRGR